jgi:hypothetical protein
MANISYSKQSLYHETPIVGRFLEYYVHRSIGPADDDGLLKIDHRWVNRPDLLALDLYGDEKYEMVIPLRNKMENPIFDMVFDLWVYTPSLVRVQKIFG